MKLTAGKKAPNIILPAIDGSAFNLETLRGRRYLLTFYRFATCPLCNLRVHEIVTRFAELGGEFGVVAVFDAPLAHLQKHAGKHKAPFPILADENNKYYKIYGIEHSFTGMLKGMVTRMPKLLYGMFGKGYIPLPVGSFTTMPADFLVDERGIIQTAYYGRDEGDHLSFDILKSFATSGAFIGT